MKRIFFGLLIIILSFIQYFYSRSYKTNPVVEWQELELLIRDVKIDKSIAKEKLIKIVHQLDKKYKNNTFVDRWSFPLEGYDYRSVGGKDGDGFRTDIIYGPYGVKGYNFYDGNKHGGHPAHDIFIKDNNQDSLDDKTSLPVNVLSMKDCVVLSINTSWKNDSTVRGGNYVWTYNPKEKIFLYYAHLDKIFVEPGQILQSGTKIGTVGRTGFLADKKKSPTHVHIMVLKFNNGDMEPYNFYKEIKFLKG